MGKDSQKRTEAQYRLILSRKYTQPNRYESQLLNFINQHPSHPFTQEAYISLGNYYYEQKQYEKAIEYFQHIEVTTVNRTNLKSLYRLGHSYFELENYTKAKTLFNIITALPFEYIAEANYYLGYIYWKEKEYKVALFSLTYARNHLVNKTVEIDEIILSIHYRTENYDELIDYVMELKQENYVLSANMYLLLGESYFIKQQYIEAVEYLSQYTSEVQAILKVDRAICIV